MTDYRAWGMDSRGEGWWTHAACRDEDPEWWVIAATSNAARIEANWRAVAICNRCPVTSQCLDENERLGTTGVIVAGRAARPTRRARVCRRAGCDVAFTPVNSNALYCGDPCRKKAKDALERARQRRYTAGQRAKTAAEVGA